MKLEAPATSTCDVLIIGSGGAALRAAIEARKGGAEVLLVSKSRIGYGNNTAMAGGLLCAATGWREPKDNPELHIQDTIRGGRFLNHQKMVEVMCQKAGEEVRAIQENGVPLRKRGNEYSVLWMPGHTYPRSILCQNAIGTDFTLPLRDSAVKLGTKLIEGVLITRLLMHGKAVAGAFGFDEKGQVHAFHAKATILATGGLTQIYARTDNAVGTTGDGMALAYDAGASLADMEFVQWYPTTLGERGGRGAIYEILIAREGGKLRNNLGEDILEKRGITDFVTKTRDVVSRAIAEEIVAGRSNNGFVTFDLSGIADDRMERLKPSLPVGITKENRTIPVSPNAHFTCGGVRTDEETQTGVDGLYASGEVTAGIHGANRIATNAITEIFVFGAIAGRKAAAHAKHSKASPDAADVARATEELKHKATSRGDEDIEVLRHALKQTMWDKAGLARTKEGLSNALSDIASLTERSRKLSVPDLKALTGAVRLENMLAVSEMVVTAAIRRTESRGVHYRIDYPNRNDKDWLKNILVARRGDGMEMKDVPVDMAVVKV